MVGADLTTIDGVGVETAEAIVSEYGTDLSKFAGEKQFIAHLQLAPRQAISGGKPIKKAKRKTTGTRAGRALRMAATGLRKSASALGAYYRRISRSKGANERRSPRLLASAKGDFSTAILRSPRLALRTDVCPPPICRPDVFGQSGHIERERSFEVCLYPMVRVFATRLNWSPMYAEKADDAALTLPISSPLLKSWAPCRVIFSGGFLPGKKRVTHN
jgi:Transposase IS116/IS110/IS902 family